jgi:D-methionine transport system substrate-binding protein
MKHGISKLTSIPGYSRLVLGVGLLLAASIAFGWTPFQNRSHIRILAAPGPESEILRFVRDRHPELGLDVTVSAEDYVSALTGGDVDVASADTHVGFREQVRNTSAALVSAGETVTKSLGFYASPGAALAQFTAGTTVVLPVEKRAQARALLLLYSSGYVTFTRDADTNLTLNEVSGNPKELTFVAAPQPERLATLRAPGSVLVALEYDEAATLGLQPARDAKLMEDGFSPFANVLVVRERDASAPWLKALVSAYRETEVKTFILRTYNDSVRRPW